MSAHADKVNIGRDKVLNEEDETSVSVDMERKSLCMFGIQCARLSAFV